MRSAGIEQRRRTGQIFKRGKQLVEANRLGNGLRQSARHAKEEILRCFDDRARSRILQQITVIHRANAEKLKSVGARIVYRAIQLARVRANKVRGLLRDQTRTENPPRSTAKTKKYSDSGLLSR